MIKNIILDVGRVLISYDNETLMGGLGFDEKTKTVVYDAMFENPLWDEGDRGTYEPEELIKKFIANAPDYESQIRLAYDEVANNMDVFPYVEPWVKSLKDAGYSLYILSNYSKKIYEDTKNKMTFMPYMDGSIFSYKYKVIKPDEKIYKILLEKYELVPQESVFIDDRFDNIDTAKRLGIHGIVFESYEQAKKDLNELLKKHN